MLTKQFLEAVVTSPALKTLQAEPEDLKTCDPIRKAFERLAYALNASLTLRPGGTPGVWLVDTDKRELLGIPPLNPAELVIYCFNLTLLTGNDITVETSKSMVQTLLEFEGFDSVEVDNALTRVLEVSVAV